MDFNFTFTLDRTTFDTAEMCDDEIRDFINITRMIMERSHTHMFESGDNTIGRIVHAAGINAGLKEVLATRTPPKLFGLL